MKNYRFFACAAVIALIASGCSSTRRNPDALRESRNRPVDVRVDSLEVGSSQLNPGITHTHITLDLGKQPSPAKTLIEGKGLFQNQHIMGWGALNPEPSPGVYDWSTLDARMDLIRDTGGVPVITLCCSPDWMKGGQPGQTDWRKLNAAPTEDHYPHFAALAGQVARRYPNVKHYQIWSGMKGFYNRKTQRWDHAAYTRLYNLVYRELKSVDQSIQVGGPNITMDSWSDPKRVGGSAIKGRWGTVDPRTIAAVRHWLKNKEGADFISLDISTPNKDGRSETDIFRATQKISAIARWVREQTDLPLWAARWHLFPSKGPVLGLARQSAALSTGLAQMIKSGVEVELLWQPQAEGDTCVGCLWTDTRFPAGGQPTLSYSVVESVTSNFRPGTRLLRTRVSSPEMTAISSESVTLLVNHSPRTRDVRLNGRPGRLDPYEVRLFPRPAPQS